MDWNFFGQPKTDPTSGTSRSVTMARNGRNGPMPRMITVTVNRTIAYIGKPCYCPTHRRRPVPSSSTMVNIVNNNEKKRKRISVSIITQVLVLSAAALAVVAAALMMMMMMKTKTQQQHQLPPSSKQEPAPLLKPVPTAAGGGRNSNAGTTTTTKTTTTIMSYQTPLAYGTKSGKEQTAQLVQQALQAGFRHFVTGGHHASHNETGVGEGWTRSSLARHEIFLQTCFVPWNGKDFAPQPGDPPQAPPIAQQVHVSVQASLRNLQTDYIDAVVFHNFRAQLVDFDQMMQAWRVLEDYVQQGVIRYLGMTSVHDMEHWKRLHQQAVVKPTILQNRFHSNRQYDVQNQETFRDMNILQLQRFWLLNGSSGQGRANRDMAARKNVTSQQLLLAFVMSLGSNTCLVGTHSVQHMRDDVEIATCYQHAFDSEQERQVYAQKLGFKPKSWDLYHPIIVLGKTPQENQREFASCRAQFTKSMSMK